MTVQDIVNAVSTDTRQVLNSSGNDANVIMSWVDRVQKDVLHSSLYVNQNLATTSISTAISTNSYTLTPSTPIRRIVSVFDITFNMSLSPSDVDLDAPTPVQARVDEEGGKTAIGSPRPFQAYTFGGTPEFFRFIAPTTLVIRPAPPSTAWLSTLNITYEQLVPTVTSLTTTLLVPDDGKDVVCAGVNWMAMAYIGRQQEAMSWFQLYQQLKQGNRVGVMR